MGMPKFERQNSHFIKFTDEIYKFEEILRLEQVIQKLNEKVAEEKIKRKGAERDLKKFHENSTELKNELDNIKRQNSYLAKKLREINECQICCEDKCNRVLSCGHLFCSK